MVNGPVPVAGDAILFLVVVVVVVVIPSGIVASGLVVMAVTTTPIDRASGGAVPVVVGSASIDLDLVEEVIEFRWG